MNEELNRLAASYLQTLRNKPVKIVSAEEALKDVTPIDWDSDVLSGKRKVTVTLDDKREVDKEKGIPWIAE